MSWDTTEATGETSVDSYLDATSTSTGAPILYTASAGDSGHAAEYPAASPNVIGVGGTTLNGCSDTSCAGFTSETAWSDSGGGISAYEKIPAYQSAYGGPVSDESSGGISALTGGQRAIPDVSFDANPDTGVSVYDSTAYESQTGWFTLGGTSVGAPNWAGILAVGEGSAGRLQGAQKVYGSGYLSFLRDITSGTNGSCGADCTAGTGYDLVTGLGSPMSYPSRGVTAPALPTFGTYPSWLPANDSLSNTDVAEGSDATLSVMQAISALYTDVGVSPFSCSIASTANTVCEQPTASTPNPDTAHSDETDNFSGTQESQGINDVGSANGQNELCNGTPGAPAGTTVDYARSSNPVSLPTCPSGVELGFAKDSVVAVDFQAINPSLYGTPKGYLTQTDPQCTSAGRYPSYAPSNGELACTAFPAAGIGPVADGWLPTDPTNCGSGGGPACSGTPFTNITNTAISGGTGATSVAYRLFCQHGPSTIPNASQITDWGQLTNLERGEERGHGRARRRRYAHRRPYPHHRHRQRVGNGLDLLQFRPVGNRVPAVSADCGGGSGTVSSSDVDVNAASGPDPDADQGPAGSSFVQNPEVSLESDANQIGDFANANWPSDPADEAVDIATSLYSMSYGVFGVNAHASVASIESGKIPAGDPGTFAAQILQADGVVASATRAVQRVSDVHEHCSTSTGRTRSGRRRPGFSTGSAIRTRQSKREQTRSTERTTTVTSPTSSMVSTDIPA